MTITLAYDPVSSEAAAQTVCAIRQAFHGARSCSLSERRHTIWETELGVISASFRSAHAAML